MRKLWDFHGISQLNKAELIQELTKRIADNLESWLQYLGSEQTEFLKEIIMQCEKYSAAYIEVNEFTFYIADYFKARGVVFLGQHQESAIFLIPGELRIKIKSILNRKCLSKGSSQLKYTIKKIHDQTARLSLEQGKLAMKSDQLKNAAFQNNEKKQII